jgi:hypothetical protein
MLRKLSGPANSSMESPGAIHGRTPSSGATGRSFSGCIRSFSTWGPIQLTQFHAANRPRRHPPREGARKSSWVPSSRRRLIFPDRGSPAVARLISLPKRTQALGTRTYALSAMSRHRVVAVHRGVSRSVCSVVTSALASGQTAYGPPDGSGERQLLVAGRQSYRLAG